MHDHHHGHDHDHHHVPGSPKRLVATICVTMALFLAELMGGIISNSLALLADAGHMLTDAAGLFMALVALILGRRAATEQATYGHRRAEVFAAMLNAVSVLAIAVWIAVEAFGRLGGHAHVKTTEMILIAVAGLVANLIGMWLLREPAQESVNIRGAYLHVIVDAAGSVAVIVSGVIIAATGWMWVDTMVSLAIAALIIPRSVKLLGHCVAILFERTPAGLDTAAVRTDLAALDGVTDVHDLHIWSISGSEVLLTAHLVAEPGITHDGDHDHGGHGHDGVGCPAAGPDGGLLDAARAMLAERHGITHATLQIESPGHAAHEDHLHA